MTTGDYKDNKDNVELIREFSFMALTYFKQYHLSVKHLTQSVLWGSEVDPRNDKTVVAVSFLASETHCHPLPFKIVFSFCTLVADSWCNRWYGGEALLLEYSQIFWSAKQLF